MERCVVISNPKGRSPVQTFSWKVFAMTGDVDAYLLFKEFNRTHENRDREDDFEEEETDQYDNGW